VELGQDEALKNAQKELSQVQKFWIVFPDTLETVQ